MTSGRCPVAIGLLVVAGGLVAAGCSSGSPPHRTTAVTAATAPVTSTAVPVTSSAAPATTVAGQLPTVFDCGGGAYKPATLLIVCGPGAAMATNVRWTSWNGTGASGSGSVLLAGRSPARADLQLSGVVGSGSGPQFSQLQVTWTGASPDGHPTDHFALATAPAR